MVGRALRVDALSQLSLSVHQGKYECPTSLPNRHSPEASESPLRIGAKSASVDVRRGDVHQSAIVVPVRSGLAVNGAAMWLDIAADGLAEFGNGPLVTTVVRELADTSTDHKICALQRRHEL